MEKEKRKAENTGKLKIGDNWNAITIIALSQTNPLKAIAEFVENSIDADAKNITIIRGRQKGSAYLKIIDDGSGIDDFRYVATHIGDSIKRELKKKGATGIQGEFEIGLLSFRTVGEELVITSKGKSGTTRKMTLVKTESRLQHQRCQYPFRTYRHRAFHITHSAGNKTACRRKDTELPGLRAQGQNHQTQDQYQDCRQKQQKRYYSRAEKIQRKADPLFVPAEKPPGRNIY